ncbi:MAG TPA: hypothetical protein VN868_01520, partial [Terriglobales bacterium]|nr:hypothetical protein [Terriglobales bacterium]
RGAFFYTDLAAKQGEEMELTLVMPCEITLTENMRVRCRGKVTRVQQVERKFGVAVQLEAYEYLAEATSVAQASANFPRISAAHAPNPPGKSVTLLDVPVVAADGSESVP